MATPLPADLETLLLALEKAGCSRSLDLIVSLHEPVEPASLIGLGFAIKHVMQSLPMISGTLSSDRLRALAALPEVRAIELDGEMQAYLRTL